MNSLTTYLHFSGQCRAAMAFYRECFGGELELLPFPDASGQPDADPQAPVMHSKLDRDGRPLLMASDYPPGTDAAGLGNNFAVFVDCASPAELERLFAALSAHGTVTVAPSDMPSGRFGMCNDAFGISWILNASEAG